MTERPVVTDVRYIPAGTADAATGLLGFLAFRLGPVLIDGVTLRRTRAGRLALSYPEKRTETGCCFPYVRPADDTTRLALEAAVLAALRDQAGLAP